MLENSKFCISFKFSGTQRHCPRQRPAARSCSAICCSLLYKLSLLVLLCVLGLLLLQNNSQLKTVEPLPTARIFCIISTFDFRHNSVAVHTKRTWSKKCDHHLFVSNDAHEEVEPAVFAHINDKWQQMRAQLEYVYKYHFDEGDWFLYINDDNYVMVENLRYMLHTYSPEELIYFGCKLRSETNQAYMYDRSGIVLSSAALSQFVLRAMPNQTICSPDPQGYAPYEELGRCLSNVNVLPGDSRDHLGYHRFLPFHMKDYFIGSLNYSLPHHKHFLDRSYYGLIDFKVPISKQLICTKMEYMPNIYNHYYLTYQVKIFGTPQRTLVNEIQKHPN
ncbi:glycoprotein-N-acetylgalactosamine 3-beta-galactosyltransferase 1-like [Drosophila hydei]|uniref:N-acetylgalactosaminide beta-1,3-galactosyltransferase n=1 Tax=Drosophila hydei TaxID=7224 RepID=A0A6J1LRS7_DROHY|nr:glycoprotein-N-acetylgalactosamine 3-beta-galactosyltransferase 1-like [Drosophila hydei]